jgi:hypothetical protein
VKVKYFACLLAANLHNADRRAFRCFRRSRAYSCEHPEEHRNDNPDVISEHERRDLAGAAFADNAT